MGVYSYKITFFSTITAIRIPNIPLKILLENFLSWRYWRLLTLWQYWPLLGGSSANSNCASLHTRKIRGKMRSCYLYLLSLQITVAQNVKWWMAVAGARSSFYAVIRCNVIRSRTVTAPAAWYRRQGPWRWAIRGNWWHQLSWGKLETRNSGLPTKAQIITEIEIERNPQ